MYALLIQEGGQISHKSALSFVQSHRLASPGVTKRNGSKEKLDIRTGEIIKRMGHVYRHIAWIFLVFAVTARKNKQRR
jgi:hypothetical protein